jgi:uncharacterized protein
MRVVVTGGTGFLGGALVRRLRADGHEVIVLTRRPSGDGQLAWSPGTPPGGQPWARAIDGAGAVVNLAGESIASGRWTSARKRAIRESRVTATHGLVAAILSAAQPPPVLLSSSAVGIYGSRGEETLTEQSPIGAGFLAEVGRAWEQEALAAAAVTRVVLLRTGLVLGKGGGALPQLALPFRLGVGGPVGSGEQYLSWIHLDDWVSLARWALDTAAVSGPLNATAPGPVTNAEFARVLGRVLRRPAWLPAPAFALRLALGEMADALILEGQRVLPARARELGFTFEHPTIDGALRAIYGPGD